MKATLRKNPRVAVLAALAFVSTAAVAQQAATPVVSQAADNTRVNVRDKTSDTLKPTDQPNDAADIKVAAAVRRSITKDGSLSTLAHNVKLIAASGVVTLRGPVANEAEKAKVEQLATQVAGVSSVRNELDIKQ